MVHRHKGDHREAHDGFNRATNTSVLWHRKHKKNSCSLSNPLAYTDQWKGPLEVVSEAGGHRDEFFSRSLGRDGLQREYWSETHISTENIRKHETFTSCSQTHDSQNSVWKIKRTSTYSYKLYVNEIMQHSQAGTLKHRRIDAHSDTHKPTGNFNIPKLSKYW